MEQKKLEQAEIENVNNRGETVNVAEILEDSEYAIGDAIKIMDGKFGGGFFVNYLQDTGRKTGHLQLILQYPDGQVKRIYLAKNCFKIANIEDDGIGEVEANGAEITPKLQESIKVGDFRILEKYETPRMPIPSQVLWKLIVDNFEKIPVVQIYGTEDFVGMYYRLYNLAIAADAGSMTKYRENDVRFLVTKDELEEVATENGWTLSELRTELNLRGLLVKDKPHLKNGSIVVNSYQLTKKIDGRVERFYAIKKKITIASDKNDRTKLAEFSTDLYETEAEKEMKDLRLRNDCLKEQIEEKEKEIRSLYQNRIDDTTEEEFREHCI